MKTVVLSSATASLSSSSHSTDDSLSATHLSDSIRTSSSTTSKSRFLQRMIPFRRSTTHRFHQLPTEVTPYDQYACLVHFLDDTERIFYVNRQCLGLDLLNEVFDYVGLNSDRCYFALLMEDLTQDLAYRWLDSHKTLRKQFPQTANSVHLYLKVRFFAVDPSVQLNNEYTKYLCVLQIKKELLSGKMWCSRTTAALLASYIVQSELGDYDVDVHRTGYLSDFRFVPFQNTEFDGEVEQYHQEHRGQSPADTEMNYLRIASSLEMYGVELHKVSAKVANGNITSSNSTIELQVGVGAGGLSIFRNFTKLNTFTWDRITKLSFKRRTFYIQLVKDHTSPDDNSIVFTLRNYHCCKYLWKSCVDQHTFLRCSSMPSMSHVRVSKEKISHGLIIAGNDSQQTTFQRMSSQRLTRPKAMSHGSSTLPSTSALVSTMKKVLPEATVVRSTSNVSISASNPSIPVKPPRLARDTSNAQPSTFSPVQQNSNGQQSKSTTLYQTDFEYSSPISTGNLSTDASPSLNPTTSRIDEADEQRNFQIIKLQPDTASRYGFNVKKNGDDRAPVFISKVVSNSPASEAQLHEGDLILAINQIDVRPYHHEEVVKMIRQSRERLDGEIELWVKSKSTNPLETSLQTLRDDLRSSHLLEQYESLPRRKEDLTFDIASRPENVSLNRYRDVLAYDQTRVVLQNDAKHDYINANHITMSMPSNELLNRYIATQGPLPNTCEAFWRMIWEQECTLILMLTTLFESGRMKCHQYWPNVSESMTYGCFTIRCRRERKESDLIYREFIVINQEAHQERFVYQIQNETWPDHGVPDDHESFVEFLLEIRELRKAKRDAPILVHCSAGIGRTGVLILMETALCLIESNQGVFPLAIVRQMREQRLGMIQTAGQFQFACEAILHAYDQGLIHS